MVANDCLGDTLVASDCLGAFMKLLMAERGLLMAVWGSRANAGVPFYYINYIFFILKAVLIIYLYSFFVVKADCIKEYRLHRLCQIQDVKTFILLHLIISFTN